MTRSHDNQTQDSREKRTFVKRGAGVFAVPRPGGRGLRGDIRGGARERGSLLILCVTVLVIIALVGIAYLQRVRMDQFATARHERSYINIVINGILSEIGGQMQDDVELNQSSNRPLYDYPWTDPNEREYVATFEYSSPADPRVNGYRRTGNNPPAPQDDRWLASSAPVWVPGANEYRWLHLTNLTGIWLDLPDSNSGGTVANRPIELPIIFTPAQIGQAERSDTDLALTNNQIRGLIYPKPGYEPRGEDADGDGIVDSRWQWTPVSVRNLGGRKFVMAVRIVDLSSMLNVNTATSLTYDGSPGTPITARGHNPSWVDLSRLMSRMPNAFISTGEWRNELSDLINHRILPLTSAVPQKLDAFNVGGAIILERTRELQTLWEEQASIFGNTDRNYLMDSEMELRRSGGINDRTQVSTLEIQMGQSYAAGNQLSRALRQHPALSNDGGVIGAEGSYQDVVGNGGSTNAQISRWFYGADPGNLAEPDTDSVAVRNREYPAIRHMLTTASGAGIYAPVLLGQGGDQNSAKYQFSLNDDWDHPPADLAIRANNLRDQLRAVFKRTRANLGGNYLGLTDAEVNDLVDEYIVSIQDYADPDTVPSARPLSSGGATAYGMERLPFLREVYVQALYADADLRDAAGVQQGDPGFTLLDGLYDTWTSDPTEVGGETYAMVIELGNPFNHKIFGIDPDTTDAYTVGLEGQVEIAVYQNNVEITSWLINRADTVGNDIPDIDARDSAGDGDTLLIVSPPKDKIDTNLVRDSGTNNDGSDLPGDLGLTSSNAQRIVLNSDRLTQGFTPNGGTLMIELRVNTPNGFVAYDRLELHPDTDLPDNTTHAANAAAKHVIAQASSARDSEGIRYVVDDGPGTADYSTNFPSDTWAYSAATDRFGNDNKGDDIVTHPDDPNFYDKLQLPLPDEPMHSLAELGFIHMFGFTDTQTFSERMSSNNATTFKPGEHFLWVDPRDPYNPSSLHPDFDVVVAPYGVPHAALVMDLFTTVSPRTDGNDNDNDDGDNVLTTNADSVGPSDELFVPGKININTMPMHLMALSSPLGEDLDAAEALSRTIVAYRDEPLRQGLRGGSGPHGQYWTPGARVPDVTQIRNPDGGPHLPAFAVSGFPDDRLNRPGIASLGEILYLNPGGPENDMLRYGLDNTNALPARMDTYPDPNDSTANGPAENQRDDNEQLLARFAMLSQAYGVRSDRFVVYGVVRGYEDNAFNQLPVETARFIAVIDRGSMQTSNPNPRVIGFVRY